MNKKTAQYQRNIEVGNTEKADSGTIDFPELCIGDGNAHMSVNMSYALNFSKGKSSVTVTLRCDQTEDMLDRAADMALCKADELAVEGLHMAAARIEQLRAGGMDI